MVMSEIYRFGHFALDAGAGMLFDGSEPTLLGQRGVALLRLLLVQEKIKIRLLKNRTRNKS